MRGGAGSGANNRDKRSQLRPPCTQQTTLAPLSARLTSLSSLCPSSLTVIILYFLFHSFFHPSTSLSVPTFTRITPLFILSFLYSPLPPSLPFIHSSPSVPSFSLSHSFPSFPLLSSLHPPPPESTRTCMRRRRRSTEQGRKLHRIVFSLSVHVGKHRAAAAELQAQNVSACATHLLEQFLHAAAHVKHSH